MFGAYHFSGHPVDFQIILELTKTAPNQKLTVYKLQIEYSAPGGLRNSEIVVLAWRTKPWLASEKV